MSPGSELIVVVSGLPRSGTSMMMRMLQVGGLSVLTDGVRAPDEDNPRGYFELEAVKRSERDSSWVEQSRAGSSIRGSRLSPSTISRKRRSRVRDL